MVSNIFNGNNSGNSNTNSSGTGGTVPRKGLGAMGRFSSKRVEKVEENVSNPNPTVSPGTKVPANLDESELNFVRQSRADRERQGLLSPYTEADVKYYIQQESLALRSVSGIKGSRIINLDYLLNAPQDFFLDFQKKAKQAQIVAITGMTDKGVESKVSQVFANMSSPEVLEDAYAHIAPIVDTAVSSQGFRGHELPIVKNILIAEILGFGPIDPLWRDERVTEILINGPKDVQVEIDGKLYRVPACQFVNEAHVLETINTKIFGPLNKKVTLNSPRVKGRLYDNSRIYAVHPSLCPAGPNVAIRRHPDKFWTPADLVALGSGTPELFTAIGNMINHGASLCISGGTGTGKTSLLNALTGFYPDDVRLLSLEDNIEMKPHPGKMWAAAMECVEKRVDQDEGFKGVTMRDLVKSSLQMRPDGIVVGEVTDGAAFDLCQALNTGHFGMSTVHANSEYECVQRLKDLISQAGLAKDDAIYPLIAAAFDAIIQIARFPDGSRRIIAVSEVAPEPEKHASGQVHLPTRPLWKFVNKGYDENGKIVGVYEQVGDFCETRKARYNLESYDPLTWEQLSEMSKIPQKFLDEQKRARELRNSL